MTSNPQLSSNTALEYAVKNDILKLAQWAFQKSDKPTNIEECLSIGMSKTTSKEIIDLLISKLKVDTKPKEELKTDKPKELDSDRPVLINGISFTTNSILTRRIAEDPELALKELKEGKYTLGELNYEHKNAWYFTILHLLCDRQVVPIFEEIIEFLLTKTEIDINALSSGGNTAFTIGTFQSGKVLISDKVIKLFLDHPKFHHEMKFQGKTLLSYALSEPENYANLIRLLLECPKTILKTESGLHPITYIVKQAISNVKYLNLLESILASPKIKFLQKLIFEGFEGEAFSSAVFTVIAKSKRIKLHLYEGSDDEEAVMYHFNHAHLTSILKIYLEHYPDGIW